MTATTMPHRPLGSTGLSVSELCLGTMQFRWTASAADSFRMLDAFAAAGGNFIDTADVYTAWARGLRGGEAEGIIGQWMARKRNRREFIVATKVRGRMWEGPTGEGLSRPHIIAAAEDSLRRLKTDYIDLYQTHWYDEAVPIEATLDAFARLIRQGKVRHAGASNYTPGMLAEALATSRATGLPPFVSYQPRYNLLERTLETEHLWLIRKYGLAVVAYSPLMRGLLSGKYRAGRPVPKSARAASLGPLLNERAWKVVDKLEELGRRRGRSVAQMALGWLLSHDWVTSPIIGASNPAQLADNLGAAGLRLEETEMKELDTLTKS